MSIFYSKFGKKVTWRDHAQYLRNQGLSSVDISIIGDDNTDCQGYYTLWKKAVIRLNGYEKKISSSDYPSAHDSAIKTLKINNFLSDIVKAADKLKKHGLEVTVGGMTVAEYESSMHQKSASAYI